MKVDLPDGFTLSAIACEVPHPEPFKDRPERVTAEWRGPDSWGIYWNGDAWNRRQRRFECEPLPSSRTDRWKSTHRFTWEEVQREAPRARRKVEEWVKYWAERRSNAG